MGTIRKENDIFLANSIYLTIEYQKFQYMRRQPSANLPKVDMARTAAYAMDFVNPGTILFHSIEQAVQSHKPYTPV